MCETNERIENISKEMESYSKKIIIKMFKKKQMDILELKTKITKILKFNGQAQYIEWRGQMIESVNLKIEI